MDLILITGRFVIMKFALKQNTFNLNMMEV